MKALFGIVLTAMAVLGLSLAFSSNAPDRPPGVSADRWAPISNGLGVVLIPDSNLRPAPAPLVGPFGGGAIHSGDPAYVTATALYIDPTPAVQKIIEEGTPVRGYIMVRRGKVWRPLMVVPPTIDN